MAALWRIFSAPVKVGVEVWTEPGKSLIDYLIKFQKLTLSVGVVLSQVGGLVRVGCWVVDKVGLKLTQSPTGVEVGVGSWPKQIW